MTINMKELEEAVQGPGKFEGCEPIVAHFYGASMDGDGEVLADMDTEGIWAARFTLDAEEAEAFGRGRGEEFTLIQDSQGFVYEAGQ